MAEKIPIVEDERNLRKLHQMNCKKAEKYLAAFADGELRGWWRRRAFVKHLEKCVLCQKMVEIQKQIKDLLHTNVRQIKAPDELGAKIHQALESEWY